MNITLSTYLYASDAVISHTTLIKRERRNGGSEMSDLLWDVTFINKEGNKQVACFSSRTEQGAVIMACTLGAKMIISVEEVR
ncbi:hypothetical protein CN611_07395 [Bacillus wiedmannii]|uniref:Uncharacterized protein n=1 Tax=Bacillus wiedmannii TaxID=1890302 RepID=A0A2A8BSS7_9BACI|nr:hypothetical protein CN611_07395 [Bacillus wiedmannii]